MDNESYLYLINPDDPLFPEKSSVVKNLHESEKITNEILRDKENLLLILATIIIGSLLGFFIDKRNFMAIFLLLNILVGLIIWRVDIYRSEEIKFVNFFNKMIEIRDSLDIQRIPIK